MRVQDGDHVVQAVAVDVIDAHNAAAHNIAAIACESLRMVFPGPRLVAGGRLLPPAIRIDDIHASVAVNVAHTDAVRRPVALFGDVVHDPVAGRIGGIGLGIAHIILGHVNQFRLAVAIYIAHHPYFGLIGGYYQVLFPAARFAFWIDIKPDPRVTRETAINYVGPAVAREVADELHPVVARIIVGRIGGQRQIDFAVRSVIGPVENVWAGDDIHHAVVIEIGRAGAPGVIEIAQTLHAKVIRNLFRLAFHQRDVFVRHIFELDFAGAARVECDGAVITDLRIGYAGAGFAAFIKKGPHDIGVEKYFDTVPVAGAQAGIGARYGEHGANLRRRTTPASAATAGRIGIERWRDTHLPTAGAQPIALYFMALRI